MFNRKKIMANASVALISALLLCSCGKEVKKNSVVLTPPELLEETYNLVEAEKGSMTKNYSLINGSIYFQDSTHVYSSGAGEITKVISAYSQKVSCGDVLVEYLVTVDPVAIAEQQIKIEKAERDFLVEKKEREQELLEFTEAVNALEGGKRQLKELELAKLQESFDSFVTRNLNSINNQKSQIEGLKSSAGKNTVNAPCDGYLLNFFSKKAGDTLNYGETIATLVLPEDALIRFADSKRQINYGAKVNIANVYNSAIKTTGIVVSAADVIPDSMWDGNVYVKPDSSFIPDTWSGYTLMSVEMDISNIDIIPSTAVYTDSSRRYVLLYNDGLISRRYVNFGLTTSGSAWILNGIEEGQYYVSK